MAVYTISPFIGPVAGPLIGGFINQVSSHDIPYVLSHNDLTEYELEMDVPRLDNMDLR